MNIYIYDTDNNKSAISVFFEKYCVLVLLMQSALKHKMDTDEKKPCH